MEQTLPGMSKVVKTISTLTWLVEGLLCYGANSASSTEKNLKMRQISSYINHFEIKLNLTLMETGIILGL